MNRNHLFRGIFPLLLILKANLFCSFAFAQGLDLDPNEIRGNASKKPVAVLQSRYFLKAWRPEIGVMGGQLLNEAYTSTNIAGGRLSFFISEWIGFEGQYLRSTIQDSADRKALNKLKFKPIDDPDPNKIVTPDPEINAVHRMIDFNLVAAPFYGKLNFLDWLILYTDIYFTFGGSKVSTDQGEKNAVLFGIGERFYIGESWSLRVDVRDRVFKETRAFETSTRNLWSVDFGLSFFFF